MRLCRCGLGARDIFAFASQDGDWRTDLNALLAFRNEDLCNCALVHGLDFHRRLIGFDFGENVARGDLVSLLHQPFCEGSFLHRGGERGHLEFDGHNKQVRRGKLAWLKANAAT